MRVLRLLCCVAALTAFVAPAAHADEFNKLTYLTFSGPGQIPGATLGAGTYMFKLADTMGDRHIVQVFDKDGSKLYATLLAVPDYRIDTPEKNIVLFGERPAGTPQALKAWWYPGDSAGDEFVYPKSQAVKIARANHQSVLSMNDEGSSDRAKMKTARFGRVNENGETSTNTATAANGNATAKGDTASNGTAATTGTTASDTTRSAAPAASGTSGTTTPSTTDCATTTDRDRSARASDRTATTTTGNRSSARRSGVNAQSSGNANTTTSNDNANRANRNSRRHLPRTASNLPLVELLSGLAFAGALATRQLRHRFAERA